MGAQLNIKSSEVRELALQLAAETGESLTHAIARALRERLERVRQPTHDELMRKWMLIGDENARMFPDGPNSSTMDAMLYDERIGLPRTDDR